MTGVSSRNDQDITPDGVQTVVDTVPRQAMVLAAGRGLRLRPLTAYRAKPSLPLMGRPLLEYTLRMLQAAGVERVVVNLHHQRETIESLLDHYRGHESRPVSIERSYEEEILGTAGGLKKVESFFGEEPFLLVNGDTLVAPDLLAMARKHRQYGAEATLLLRDRPNGSSYSSLQLDRDGRILSLSANDSGPGYMFAGLWLLEPSIFAHLSGRPAGLERELLPALIRTGAAVGSVQDVAWMSIDTPRRYLGASLDMARRGLFASHWALTRRAIRSNGGGWQPLAWTGEHCRLGTGVSLRGDVIMGSGCELGARSRLENCVLWDRVRLGEGVSITNCILADGVELPAGAEQVNKVIMRVEGDASRFRGREIEDGLVVADIRH